MKKTFLAVVLVVVMALASVMSVAAANSSQGTPSVSEGNQGAYIIRTGEKQFLNDKGTEDTSDDEFLANKADILAYNAGTKTLKALLNGDADYAKVEKKTDLTKIFDLHDVDGGNKVNGLHVVTINVPNLTEKCSDVVALHYSMVDGAWEVLETKFDTAKHTVTITTDDLSPIAIFATVSSGSGSGQSPATGTESMTWMLWAVAAVVVLGAGVVVARKRK